MSRKTTRFADFTALELRIAAQLARSGERCKNCSEFPEDHVGGRCLFDNADTYAATIPKDEMETFLYGRKR